MTEPNVDLQTYINSTIPTAIAELSKSHTNINQIAQYCKQAYTQEDPNAVFLKTQAYMKDALANVAYHVHNVSQLLNQTLLQQTKEIAKLDVQIQAITDVYTYNNVLLLIFFL